MNCTEAQEAMLELEEASLLGDGDAELAAHLAICEACRTRANAIVDVMRGTRAQYARLVPATAPVRSGRRSVVRRAVIAVASLAAAAVLGLTVVGRSRSGGLPPGARYVDLPEIAASAISVDVPDGKNAIVFATKNPNVDVIWIF